MSLRRDIICIWGEKWARGGRWVGAGTRVGGGGCFGDGDKWEMDYVGRTVGDGNAFSERESLERQMYWGGDRLPEGDGFVGGLVRRRL